MLVDNVIIPSAEIQRSVDCPTVRRVRERIDKCRIPF
jgi:hypothetical protein